MTHLEQHKSEQAFRPHGGHPPGESSGVPEKRFHGWRLLGFLGIVIFSLMLVSAVVDWLVLGPLIGRVL